MPLAFFAWLLALQRPFLSSCSFDSRWALPTGLRHRELTHFDVLSYTDNPYSTAKVILSEICDKSNEALSFAIMGTGWQIGATAAPLMGAALAHPAKTWPSVFAGTIFERYPYSLPPIAAAALPGVACIFAVCLAEESHPDIRAGRKRAGYGKVPDSPLTPMVQDNFEVEQDDPPMMSCGAPFAFLVRVSESSPFVTLR